MITTTTVLLVIKLVSVAPPLQPVAPTSWEPYRWSGNVSAEQEARLDAQAAFMQAHHCSGMGVMFPGRLDGPFGGEGVIINDRCYWRGGS